MNTKPEQLDLVALAQGPHLTPEQRRKLVPPRTKKHGHAAPVGTGPEGETCGSCKHLYRHRMAKTYLKCELRSATWTHSYGTDVRAGDAACSKWEKPD